MAETIKDETKIDILEIEKIKNNYYDESINLKPDKESNESCIIDINEEEFEHKPKKKKSKKKNFKCPGCYPIFQENQLGHIGVYGCLGNEY